MPSFGWICNWWANLGSQSATSTPVALESSRNLQQIQTDCQTPPLISWSQNLQECDLKSGLTSHKVTLMDVQIWEQGWDRNASQELLRNSIDCIINIICNRQYNSLGGYRLLLQPWLYMFTTTAEDRTQTSLRQSCSTLCMQPMGRTGYWCTAVASFSQYGVQQVSK